MAGTIVLASGAGVELRLLPLARRSRTTPTLRVSHKYMYVQDDFSPSGSGQLNHLAVAFGVLRQTRRGLRLGLDAGVQVNSDGAPASVGSIVQLSIGLAL